MFEIENYRTRLTAIRRLEREREREKLIVKRALERNNARRK